MLPVTFHLWGSILVAHIKENAVHDLFEHLNQTSDIATSFGTSFHSTTWSKIAGLWHDLGKYAPQFQEKLQHHPLMRVDHSTAGAVHAVSESKKQFNGNANYGRILAWIIAGHHAGLADWNSVDDGGTGALKVRLDAQHRKAETKAALSQSIPEAILHQDLKSLEQWIVTLDSPEMSHWLRLLFSCVVDADFLDTESFFDPDKQNLRGNYPGIPSLEGLLNDHLQTFKPDSDVKVLRSQILSRCLDAAEKPTGIYSLNVPTGGGKTLSGMAYALKHARIHGKSRVIYVIPYTSIIEQTADVFRGIFGESVIEHHSSIEEKEESAGNEQQSRLKLAQENWDAPIIVTTAVQFFESLFSNRPGRCRKLHNIANSVIVIDEIQTLPLQYLEAIKQALKTFAIHFQTTFVLMSATQPGFEKIEMMEKTIHALGVEEMMENPTDLAQKLKRVNVRFETEKPMEWSALAETLNQMNDSVLCILNRRDDCHELWNHMEEGTYHLSARMCGAHRSKVIEEIKARKPQENRVKVIATQLVEAGVDFDFPVVYRAMAGLDSIAQAAGRCNRNGIMPHLGEVVIFRAPSDIPPFLKTAVSVTEMMLREGLDDPLAPESFLEYFRQLHRNIPLDQKKILDDLKTPLEWRFKTVAHKFKMIENENRVTVFVRYGDSPKYLAKLEQGVRERWLFRKLQRYTVDISRFHLPALIEGGGIHDLGDGVYVQAADALYHQAFGLDFSKNGVLNADDLVH